MLRTTKSMKEKYEAIQKSLFDMIPEKWEEIYLYASIIDNSSDDRNGELYFYYIPKGLLKKKPINVYEVPQKFNINEEQYLELVDRLYSIIKKLRQDFVKTGQDLWTNLSISISGCKFRVEYGYERLSLDEYSNYKRHIIWRYKYLKLGGEIKEERKIIQEYLDKEPINRREIYETGMYLKDVNNEVRFDKEERKFVLRDMETVLNKKDKKSQN